MMIFGPIPVCAVLYVSLAATCGNDPSRGLARQFFGSRF
jgi:hypothetical protein